MSEENVFLKCIVHKIEPLDLLFDYSESVSSRESTSPLFFHEKLSSNIIQAAADMLSADSNICNYYP